MSVFHLSQADAVSGLGRAEEALYAAQQCHTDIQNLVAETVGCSWIGGRATNFGNTMQPISETLGKHLQTVMQLHESAKTMVTKTFPAFDTQ
jgi:hypothetical protein